MNRDIIFAMVVVGLACFSGGYVIRGPSDCTSSVQTWLIPNLESAAAVLNQAKHGECSTWTVWQGKVVQAPGNLSRMLTKFEAIATAEKYLRAEASK